MSLLKSAMKFSIIVNILLVLILFCAFKGYMYYLESQDMLIAVSIVGGIPYHYLIFSIIFFAVMYLLVKIIWKKLRS
ncbi:MAG TPA: hypothetical protein VNR61_17735 [Niallia sp.]|nr:hypothetical protein [Niallia sp.]